jgi:myo-inositol-1(or 4)-monophosphatase
VQDEAWLAAFEAVGERVRAAVAPLVGTEAGRAELGVGAGGDRTVQLDRVAEEAALDELARLAGHGRGFSVLSEEAGLVDFGAEYPRVLLDPVDGSTNAKQGLPVFAVMVSLLDGPALADVRAGFTLNLATGERWHAVRGCGAFHNGAPLEALPGARADRIRVLGVESSPRDLGQLEPLVARASKVRLLGSMALSLAHTAAGGLEVFASPVHARIFDMTAGLLMISEVGGAVTDLQGRPLAAHPVGLEHRTTLLCASDPARHQMAREALVGYV